MKLKISLIILLVVFLATMSVVKMSSDGKQQQLAELDKASDRGTIDWFVRRAIVKGEKHVTIPAPIVDYAGGVIKDIDEALQYYDVVIAEPVAFQSSAEERRIVTWYKFKIIEKLSSKKKPVIFAHAVPDNLPDEISSLTPDEILVEKFGGSVVRNGIQVDMVDSQFPDFRISQTYLLFVAIDWSTKMAGIGGGPGGVFEVNSAGKIHPINNTPHPLKDFMNKLYANDLGKLKASINQ